MFLIISSALLLAGALSAQDLKLIPLPRSIERLEGALVLNGPVRIAVASPAAEDRFAAGLLLEELKRTRGIQASIVSEGESRVLIGRPGNRAIDEELSRRKLDVSALANSESYLLHVNRAGVVLASKTAEGVFYGLQTLRQLIGANTQIPAVSIADWPALRYRVLSIDINRGPILTEDSLRSAIRTMAEYKMNMLSLYLEHVFQYSHSPVAAPPGGEVSPEMIRRLGVYARQYHVDLVAHQQLFGHLHNLLKFELYAGMGEIPHGSVLSPASEKTYEWIRQSAEQLAKAFPSRFMHFGADETWELGEGQSREMARESGAAGVYLRHVQRVVELLRPLGKRLFLPGDIVLKHPEIIPKLPKDLIAVSWVYAPRDDYSASIEPFRKAGLDWFCSTTVHNWNRVFPAFSQTVANVNNFARDAKKSGALGMIATHWADDGEALFNMTWYGVVFSAAAAWQPGTVDTGAFDRAFDWAFYRNADETFVTAIRNLYRIHELLASAGVGGATDALFWTDPFSPHGAEVMRKAYPVASRLRLLAEQALADVAAAKAKPRRHAETIRFLQFAARRMDYLGMKIQFAKEIGDMYRAVQAEPSDTARAQNRLRRIRGMDGLLPSLRDYTNEVKALYREAWLSENRPYWLDNVLVRYDNEALGWIRKMQLFDDAAQQYFSMKALPDPEKLGLYLP